MKRPKKENYSFRETNQQYEADLNKYIDWLELQPTPTDKEIHRGLYGVIH